MATRELVMVLNASSEPLHLVRLGRAVHLVHEGKADIVRGEGVIVGAAATYRRPEMIRLRSYVHIPWRNALLTIRNLKLRDGGFCQWCTHRPGDTIDHVIPRSRGGEHRWTNVVLACRVCNNRKGDRLASELGWSLTKQPVVPTRYELFNRDPMVVSRLAIA